MLTLFTIFTKKKKHDGLTCGLTCGYCSCTNDKPQQQVQLISGFWHARMCLCCCVTIHTEKNFNALVLVDVTVNNYCDIPGHSIGNVSACRTVLFARRLSKYVAFEQSNFLNLSIPILYTCKLYCKS